MNDVDKLIQETFEKIKQSRNSRLTVKLNLAPVVYAVVASIIMSIIRVSGMWPIPWSFMLMPLWIVPLLYLVAVLSIMVVLFFKLR